MKRPGLFARSAFALGILAAFLPSRSIADQTITGNLTVTGSATVATDAAVGGSLDVEGNNLTLGNNAGNYGVGTFYLPSGSDGARWRLTRLSAWLWEVDNGGTVTPAMRLDASNNLTLYSGGAAALTLNPSAQSLSLGSATLTANGTGLTTNGAVTVGGALSAASYTASGGAVTGGTSGLALNAGGTDQNITLSPSGTGNVIVNGKLGVGTATPTTKVDVLGEVSIVGTATAEGASLFVRNEVASGMRSGLKVAALTAAGETTLPTDVVAANLTATHQNSGSVASVFGQINWAQNYSAGGTVGTLNAGRFAALNVEGATATNATGTAAYVQNLGTITNAKAINIPHIANGGTITNTYGVYVGDITSGTQVNKPFSFYASDPDADNYFAGNVGIGTSSPTAKLDVAGTANIGGNLKLMAGSATEAPLALQSGGLLTAPAFGAVEFDGTKLYLTNNVASPTRKALAYEATTLAGYGITDPVVLTSGSYANPAWLTSLAASKLTGTLPVSAMPAFSGDATTSAGSTTLTLANSGVTAGTYTKVTVDAKGRTTSGASLNASDVTTALGYTPVNKAGDTMTGGLTATTLTASNGSLTGGTAGLTVNAGGSNQNVVLAPSGTGNVTTSAPVAVTNATASTSSATGALTVSGGAGIAGNVNVGGTVATGGLTNYPVRIHTINLASQSSAQFFPVTLSGLPQGKIYRFSIELPSQSGASSFNQHSLAGAARGGGWSDYPSFYEVTNTYYDSNERSVLGLYRSTQGWVDIAVYVRGGATYYVTTDAPTVAVYTSAQTLGDTTFAIKDASGADVSGTSVAITRMFDSYGATAGRFTDRALVTASTAASTNPTTGALVVAGGVGIAGDLNVGGTFAATNYSASGGTLTGGANGLTLNAGGTNQNIVLAPSGTGSVSTAARVGISNSTASTSTTTGSATFGGGIGVAGAGYFGSVNVAPSSGSNANLFSTATGLADSIVSIQAPAGQSRQLRFNTGTSRRWLFNVNNTAESGSNAGSDFTLNTYSDADVFIDSPLSIMRAAGGAATLSRKLIVAPSAYTASSWSTTGALSQFAATTVTNSSTAASGTAASAVFHSFATPTLAATNTGVTTTDAATVYIAGAPVAGTNQTIPNAWALWNGGASRFDGNARFGGQVNMSGSQTIYGQWNSVGTTDARLEFQSNGTRTGLVGWDGSYFTLQADNGRAVRLTGGNVVIPTSTEATSTTTGALQVAGGGSFQKNLYVGGNLNVTGTISAANLSSTTLSTNTVTGNSSLTLAAGGTDQNVTLAPSGTGTVSTAGRVGISNSTASTSTTTGALTVAGGVGVAGTVNARNVTTSHGLGVLPAGLTNGQNTVYISGSGDAGGTSDLRPNSIQVTAQGANSMSIRALDVATSAQNTAGNVSMLGVRMLTYLSSTGTGSATAYSASPYVIGTGNMTGWVGYQADNGSFTSSGDVTGPMTAFANGTFGRTTATTVTAFHAQDLVKGSGVAAGFRGQVSAAIGKYNLYMDGTAANLLAGQTSITNTTASTDKDTGALVVEGGVGIEGNLNVGGTFTAANYTASGGTITGSTSVGLNLAAGGSNQNVTLTPSGTGSTILNGKVGIGTSAPAAKLDVTGGNIVVSAPSANSQDLFIANAGGRKVEIVTDAEGDGKIMLRDTGGTTTQVAITAGGSSYFNGGNVGVGTSAPSEKLQVVGAVRADVDNRMGFILREATGDNFRAGLGLKNNGDAYLELWKDDGTVTRLDANGNSYLMGGNVGVGTTTPTAKLDVAGSANIAGNLKLAGGTATQAPLMLQNGSLLNTPVFGAVEFDGTSLYVTNNVSAPSRKAVAYTATSLAGYGITDPVALTSGNYANPAWITALAASKLTGTVPAAVLPAFTGDATTAAGSTAVTLANSGVAAGTYAKVTVDAKGRVTAGSALASADVTTALGYSYAPVNKAGDTMTGGLTATTITASNGSVTGGNTGLTLNAGGNDQNITILPSGTGNVGIGTATPTAKLDVAGDTKITGNLVVTGTLTAANSNSGTNGVITGSTNGLAINAGGTGNQNITLTPTGAGSVVLNGNVGIGTAAPAYRLHLVDPTKQLSFGLGEPINSAASETGYRIATWNDNNVYVDTKLGTGGSLNFRYGEGAQTGSSNTWMVVKAGNVGIGTTAPTAKLHVNGATRFDGPVRIAKQGDLEMGEFTDEPSSP